MIAVAPKEYPARGKFYVYEHWRPDRDECFYVGKGRGRRANYMAGRNGHHKAIQAKLSRLGTSVEVRIIAEGLDEEAAFAIEIERILFWRADGCDLANMTVGGEGPTGRNVSENTRRLLSQCATGKKQSPEHVAKRTAFVLGRKQSQEEREKRRAKLVGRKRTKEIIEAMSARAKKTPVICVTEAKKFCSAKAAAEHYGVNQGNISLNCMGKRRTVCGLAFKFAGAD